MDEVFQLVSDAHVDLRDEPFELEAKCPVLVLAGDIAPMTHPVLYEYLEKWSKQFRTILFVPGNHEYYCERSVHLCRQEFEEKKPANVILLDKNTHEEDGWTFVGCTLWSRIPPRQFLTVMDGISDYTFIADEKGHQLTPETNNRWHDEHRVWLTQTLFRLRARERIAVVTHHSPLFDLDTVAPKYRQSKFNVAFMSEQSHLMGGPVKIWMFGHTHWTFDENRKGTRVVSRPVGYVGETVSETN